MMIDSFRSVGPEDRCAAPLPQHDSLSVDNLVAHNHTPLQKISFRLLLLFYCFFATISLGAADTGSIRTARADELRVKNLGSIVPAFESFRGDMYAGLLPVAWDDSATSPTAKEDENEEGELYFWFFEPSEPASDDSMLIWLNGGPGCSSLIGLLFENGPATVPHFPAGTKHTKAQTGLVPNEYSWTETARMLYVEQPMGTGFSHGPEPEDEDELSSAFYGFLQNFYEVFSDLRPHKLYIFGESYAGMYVPSIARWIHLENKKRASDSTHQQINIAGIGLGNGWVDAQAQGAAVLDYALWHGFIDAPTKETLQREFQACISGSDDPTQMPNLHPFNIPDDCGLTDVVLRALGKGAGVDNVPGPNVYDISTWDTYPGVFDLNNTVHRFFNNPAVRDALNAPSETGLGQYQWLECIPGSGRRRRRRRRLHMLDDDKPLSVVPYIAELLDDAGIRVLVYNGDLDLSVNAAGTEKVLNDMKWSGSDAWLSPGPKRAHRGLWMVQGSDNKKEMAGYCKVYKNLQFVVVYQSGHLVPTNQPEAALDLVTRFVQNKSFVDIPLPNFARATDRSADGDELSCPTNTFFALFLLVACGFISGILATLIALAIWRRTMQSRKVSSEKVETSTGEGKDFPSEGETECLLEGHKYGALDVTSFSSSSNQ